MIKEKIKAFAHAVKCPCCRRKLMNMYTVNSNDPKVEVLVDKCKEEYPYMEVRCSSCKSFVGVSPA